MKKIIALASLLLVLSLQSFASDSTTAVIPTGMTVKSAALRIVDNVTGTFLSATVSNIVIENSNPEIATVTVDTSSSLPIIKVTRVSGGSGTASVTCHISYTDPGDGLQKSEDKTIVISFTVTGAPHGAKLSLTFN